MADINVERKGPSIWPWIIGLIVLALLIWALAEMLGGDRVDTAAVVDDTVLGTTEVAPTTPTTDVTAAAAPAAVQEFVQWVDRRDPQTDMGLQHEYTSNGLRQLADALESLAQRHGDRPAVQQSIQTMRQQADRLEQSDAASTQHANMTRDAFTSAADAMNTLHQEYHPQASDVDSQVNQVRQAAQAIDTGTPLLQQQERVQTFFDRSRDAVRTMANQPQTT
ncbi:MAG TPA: hypothetical protein VGR27_15405 [Longimicrobiaceae bacterium]|nr:hypothetical protein [Longimicrobiaceae bacterium]